jgi:RNA polymerase sigma-70 factor (ECF subfamily)
MYREVARPAAASIKSLLWEWIIMLANENYASMLERSWVDLYRLARGRLGARYSAKLDPSDLVQQTFLDAHQKRSQFRGTTERERAAWLREIFANNLSNILRDYTRQKRNVAREQSIGRREDDAGRIPDASEAPTDSEQLHRLAWALTQLPEPQRVAIQLHHLQGLSLARTAEMLHRTSASVAGLVRRGMAQLRDLMAVPPCGARHS